MPGMGPAGQPTGFLEGRVLRYSEIPFFSGSAMVRVIMLPSPMPSTTDLGIIGNVKKFFKKIVSFVCVRNTYFPSVVVSIPLRSAWTRKLAII